MLAQGTYQGTPVSRAEGGREVGGHQGAKWQHPQPPGDMAGAFRGRVRKFHELGQASVGAGHAW